MALWAKAQTLQGDALQQMQNLYGTHFPIEVRHYFAHWIEDQPWQDIDPDVRGHEGKARMILDALIKQLQYKYDQLSDSDFLLRLKMKEIADHFTKNYGSNPLDLVRIIKRCISTEQALVDQATGMNQEIMTAEGAARSETNRKISEAFQLLKQFTQETENDLRVMQQKQEFFVIQYQESIRLQAQLQQVQQQPAQDPTRVLNETTLKNKKLEVDTLLQQEAQQLLQMRITLAEKHRTTFHHLSELQQRIVEEELIQWKRRQQLAGNGGPQEETLDLLQQWCEALAEIIWTNRQQIKRVEMQRQQLPIQQPGPDILPELSTTITALLSQLVTSTFIIEKQPPQVLKTQTRFQASVRLLVGGKLNVHMNPPNVKATIISENQARALLRNERIKDNDNSGEILNNTGVMEYHQATRILGVTFRNMQLKRIKRPEKKGQETVCEEKFTILFQSQFSVGGNELVFQVRTMSLPIVVIVHGNQDSNAWATILWDNAFAEPNRSPFCVPAEVTWSQLASALNCKWTYVNGRPLSESNMKYLAAKAFNINNPPESEDFGQTKISWSQFNKEPLQPNRSFTFWQWFDGVMELTKKNLKGPWEDGTILGFVNKDRARDTMLMSKQNGTFLLRFSDSEIGGITIAWVAQDPNNPSDRQVWNLQPFTTRDFGIRSLADRIHDLPHLVNLYPDIPKDEAFSKYYTPIRDKPAQTDGYVPAALKATVETLPPPIASPMTYDNPNTPHPMEGPASPMDKPTIMSPDPEMLGACGPADFDGNGGEADMSDDFLSELSNLSSENLPDNIDVNKLLNLEFVDKDAKPF
ncbi:signal transducer and activator of transcription 5B-like isoform X1 [Branchiostoma lanceolatum]|uniref:signal transducer and activator of transcription 5B-like isoform X1 n=2 Tax=Branchiostoma lanceolatum TaxID=7740 RepID=UPI0034558E5B